jgi:dipeptidyl aminopeptidase/acylaminoacyl peptidase
MRRLPCLLVSLLIPLVGCDKNSDSNGTAQDEGTAPAAGIVRTDAVAPLPSVPPADLEKARRAYTSKLTIQGPAPQEYETALPPAGVHEVRYPSGDLELRGWLSADAGDGQKRPAVVFLHGGFAFGGADWKDAEPFVKAGFVLFMPMLRGENGNPGHYECFLGEVDDAIAAGRYVASLPNVDPKHVFVAGHSTGGMLATLATMLPSPYKGAAALDGWVEMGSWVQEIPEKFTPFDRRSPEEIRIRNPMAFVASIRCPLRLYAGSDAREVNDLLASLAAMSKKDCELVPVEGDHQEMVAPAVKLAIEWFQELAKE